MLLYRVFPYLTTASEGQPGHPEYIHPAQGKGRLDNRNDYLCWYMSPEAAGAVGEVFGDLGEWTDGMFSAPFIPGSRRALGIYEVPAETPLLDLDDAKTLLSRGLRPSQVIERNRPATQAWALGIYNEKNDDGTRKWRGVRWWSFQRPQWRVIGLWDLTPSCKKVEELDLWHPAVIDAAKALHRLLP